MRLNAAAPLRGTPSSPNGLPRPARAPDVWDHWSGNYPLSFINRHFIVAAIIKAGCMRAFMVSHVLRDFELAVVLQIFGNPGRTEESFPIFVGMPAFRARRSTMCQASDRLVGRPESLHVHLVAERNRSRFWSRAIARPSL